MKKLSLFRLLAPSLPWLLLLGTAPHAHGQCFQPGQFYNSTAMYTTGVGAGYRIDVSISVASGDVNGDGKPDLVVASAESEDDQSVVVLLGNGDGTFQGSYGVGPDGGVSAYSVAVGDVNGDGKPDLIVANRNGNAVSVMLGNGDGTFQTRVNYPVGNGPRWVAVGDFNRDGKADLATANQDGNTVSVLLGNGGAFGNATSYGVGNSPQSVAVGDFNRDGKPDLTTANVGSNTVSVLLGNGDGTFEERNFTAGGGPVSVAVGDFNRDDKPDLATANQNGGNVSVLLGNGDGTFQAKADYPAGHGHNPTSLAVGDFNGDGKPDLATANLGGNAASVLLGNGAGAFTNAATYRLGPPPGYAFYGQSFARSLAVGDFNGDGKADLVTSNNFFTQEVRGNPDPTTFEVTQGYVTVLLGAPPVPVSFGVSLGGGLTCVGQPLNLTLTPSCPDTGPYTVQLSSAHGSFANPRSLGTVQAGANALPLPAGLSAGTGYRVRILYGGGQVTVPSAPFTVSAPAFSVAGYSPSVGGVPVCRGGQVTVSFSVPSGSCPLPEGRTTAQLSSAQGSFANPTSLGLVEPNAANAVTIPATVAAGTGYRIRLVHAGQASAYSRVFQIKACASRMSAEEAHLAVVPNPAAGGAIRCRVAGMDNPEFSLTTSVGRGVGVVAKTDGSGEWVLRPKQALAAGVYVVQAREGTTRLTTRVLVVE